eukprot:COSAG02_NODE_31996_length_523_cov_227.634434_1_plen_170_part_10
MLVDLGGAAVERGAAGWRGCVGGRCGCCLWLLCLGSLLEHRSCVIGGVLSELFAREELFGGPVCIGAGGLRRAVWVVAVRGVRGCWRCLCGGSVSCLARGWESLSRGDREDAHADQLDGDELADGGGASAGPRWDPARAPAQHRQRVSGRLAQGTACASQVAALPAAAAA